MRIDAHQDLIYHLNPYDVSEETKIEYEKISSQLSLEKVMSGQLDLIFSAIFVEPERVSESLNIFFEQIKAHQDLISRNNNFYLFKNKNDFQKHRIGFLLHLEGYSAEIRDLDNLIERGVRSLSLTWNNDNQYAGGAMGFQDLTIKGRDLVKEISQRPILFDLAHLNEKSFWSSLATYPKSPIVSHTACQQICNHPRNLNDEQIRAIAQAGGVIGIFFSAGCLTGTSSADIDDVVSHIVYAVQVGGIEVVGIGSDFGGIISGVPTGLEDISKFYLLEERLKNVGFSSSDISKILGDNFYRVITEVLN